jgi:hypothetical protein
MHDSEGYGRALFFLEPVLLNQLRDVVAALAAAFRALDVERV